MFSESICATREHCIYKQVGFTFASCLARLTTIEKDVGGVEAMQRQTEYWEAELLLDK